MKNAENMDINHAEPIERIDWYSQGESCSLRIGETTVVIRLVDRKGRRARISVSATQEGEKGSSSKEGGRGRQQHTPQSTPISMIPVDDAVSVK